VVAVAPSDDVVLLVASSTVRPRVFVTQDAAVAADERPYVALSTPVAPRIGAKDSPAPGFAYNRSDRVIAHQNGCYTVRS
jgi:hypothetical protein